MGSESDLPLPAGTAMGSVIIGSCCALAMVHWLPVRQRVDFKVATLVHQSLSGISPPYLADDCRLVADARERRLRSTAS